MTGPRGGGLRAARAIALVARRELGAYLRAPVAYVVGVMFLAAQGAAFSALVASLSDPHRLAPLGAVLEGYFGGTLLHWTLQLAVVALIAMRTVAEDRRAGTWEALLTAPVSETAAVVGKWLGAVGFYALLWLPTLAYLGVLAIYKPADAALDPGPVAAAYLGEIGLGAAFLAVGVAWSAATTSQILAGVGAFATTLALVLIGEAPSMGVDAPWAALVSPRGHLATFARGELALTSLVAIAGLALVGLSAAVALAGLGRRRRDEVIARAIATGLLAIIVGLAVVLAARHPASWDVTAGRRNSLDDDVRRVLDRVDEPVAVTLVRPSFAEVDPVYEEVARALARMAAAQPLLRVATIDPIAGGAEAGGAAGGGGVDGAIDGGLAGLARDAGLAPGDLARGGAVVLVAGGRRRVLDLLDLASFGAAGASAPPTVTRLAAESAVAAALAEIADRTPALVCATSGHGELALGPGQGETWAPVAARLVRDGLRVEDVGGLGAGVPARCRVVVVIAPARPLEPDETLAVDRFLAAGGRLALALPAIDAGDGGASAGAAGSAGGGGTGLELVLAGYGLGLPRAIAVDPPAALRLAGAFQVVNGYGDDAITAGFAGRRLTVWIAPRMVAITPRDGVAARALASTGADGWGETAPAAPPARDERDAPGPVAIAAVARGRGQVVVFGGASFASSTVMAQGLGAGDLLAASAIANLAGRVRPALGGGRAPEQVRLVMTRGEQRAVTALCLGVIPLVFAGLGLALVLMRRRR